MNGYVTNEVKDDGQPQDTMPHYDQPENIHPMRKVGSYSAFYFESCKFNCSKLVTRQLGVKVEVVTM